MQPFHARRGFIAKPWLLAGSSLAVMAVLAILLWNPTATKSPEKSDLVLFCAAGLMKPVQEIAAEYEKAYQVKIQIEPDASGTLLSKIRVAPEHGDLFLAAEESYIREAKGRKLVAEVIPVARQHPVIGVQPGNPKKIMAFADLLREDVKVALPNPELAAVGDAAKRALAGTGQWEALQEQSKRFAAKVSVVGKVTEAAQAVKVGTADAAVVWDATARQFGIEAVEVPVLQDQVEQATLGVLAATKHPTAALHFARFLTSCDRGQPVFAKYAFQPLEDADIWADRPELTLMSGAMLKPAIDGVVKAFGEREGVLINTIFAGCGIHVAQMKAMKEGQVPSANFPDAYFACDCSFMSKVQQWFEAAKNISRNDIVLVVQKGNPKGVQSIKDLTRPELRIGLAHPVNSALGAITDDLLKKLGLHEKTYAPDRSSPVVHADAGHDLVNKIRTGALDLVVVYRSNYLSGEESAKYLDLVEMNLPEAIAIQPYAVSKDSQHRHLMRRLLDAILSPPSKEHFGQAGFQWIADEQPK